MLLLIRASALRTRCVQYYPATKTFNTNVMDAVVVHWSLCMRKQYFQNYSSWFPYSLITLRNGIRNRRFPWAYHSYINRREKFTLSTNGNGSSAIRKRSSAETTSSSLQLSQSSSSASYNNSTTGTINNLTQFYRHWKIFLEEFLKRPRTFPIPRWITPKHYQFTTAELFGHFSFVLVAFSYAVDDFLWLRIIAVAGSSCMLVFAYYHPHGRVLYLPFKWNVLFILINSYRIGLVLFQRYAAENMLPSELVELRSHYFHLMDQIDYYRLMRIAEIKEYKKGDLVLAQGEHVRSVRMVLNGKLRVLRDGHLTYLLEDANFMSEGGIHAGLLIPGKIESCCSIVADGGGEGKDEVTRLLCWDRSELVHLLDLHEGVRRSLKAIMSWDIVRKLKGQRQLLSLNLIDDPEKWTIHRHQQTAHRYAAILHALLQQPKLLERYRKEVLKYRMIHHIGDEEHAHALSECGWTVEEYEAGKKENPFVFDDEDDEVLSHGKGKLFHGWRWYVEDIYLRLFG